MAGGALQRDCRVALVQQDRASIHRTGRTLAERIRGFIQRQTPRRTPGD